MTFYIAADDEKDALYNHDNYEIHDNEESARQQVIDDGLESCYIFKIEVSKCLNKS